MRTTGTRRGAAPKTTERGLVARPDRVALWAVFISVAALIAGAASAQAGSGGGIIPGGTGAGAGSGGGSGSVTSMGCPATELGRRALRLGDCGDDVRTLNWLLNATATKVPLGDEFEEPTDFAVRSFERTAGIAVDGVVENETAQALSRSMPKHLATWYGPGFFGNRTACGQRLTRGTAGIAHKSLPCGSRVVIRYKGNFLRTHVIDRGPYANGAKWDLTQRAARLVGFRYTDEIRVAAVARR
jgi:peptidoglycan hydrolase-like protein with peptidoglycan-binding domain